MQPYEHRKILSSYDQCAHQGSAHLHRNQECRSQVAPVTHNALVSVINRKHYKLRIVIDQHRLKLAFDHEIHMHIGLKPSMSQQLKEN